MSNCITDCCKKIVQRDDCKYAKINLGDFSNIRCVGISTEAFVCLGSGKAHNNCSLKNINDDMFICQNNNSDKEIGIFLKLDKKNSLINIIANLCDKCEDIYIVFIFDIDERDDIMAYKKVKNKLHEYKCTKNIFGIKRDGLIKIKTLKE